MLCVGDRVMVLSHYGVGNLLGHVQRVDEWAGEVRADIHMECGPKWHRYVPTAVLLQLPRPKDAQTLMATVHPDAWVFNTLPTDHGSFAQLRNCLGAPVVAMSAERIAGDISTAGEGPLTADDMDALCKWWLL